MLIVLGLVTQNKRKVMKTTPGLRSETHVHFLQLFLCRISGVGSEYADLLEAAGVDTIPELATRNAANLCKKLEEINSAKKLVRKLPTEAQVADWVDQAKKLPRVISH